MSLMMALSAAGELMGHKAPEKATLATSDKSTTVDFQFNPSSLKLSRSRGWEDGSEFAQAFPSIKWKGASNDKLGFTIILDESEKRPKGMLATAAALNPVVRLGPAAALIPGMINKDSVMETLDKFGIMTTPVENKKNKFWRPPTVEFVWDKLKFWGDDARNAAKALYSRVQSEE